MFKWLAHGPFAKLSQMVIALRRYHRGHGFEFRYSENTFFFITLFANDCIYNREDRSYRVKHSVHF